MPAWGPGFTPRPVNVGLAMDNDVVRQVSLSVLWLSPVSVIPQMPHMHSVICQWHYMIIAIYSVIKQHTIDKTDLYRVQALTVPMHLDLMALCAQ
jgi:hypothetical protein